MIAIIAVNNLGFIGKDNELMWQCSEDLKHFKAMRQGKTMLVGHNTWLELPGFLKVHKDMVVDLRGALHRDYNHENILCIGGKRTYEKYSHLFTELHISHINDDQIGDCTFPDLANLNPDCKIFNYHFETNK